MLKKTITAAVLGVSALSMIAAHAAAPGVYIAGQLGYANKHNLGDALYNSMKDKIGTAVEKGGELETKAGDLSKDGIAGRLALGYQFNQNFAVEAGYLQISHSKRGDGHVTDSDIKTLNTKINQNAIDLAAKGILPVASNFNVYGKLGVAYLTSQSEFTYSEYDRVAKKITNKKEGKIYKNQWAPEAAVGMSYNITPNVGLDASWTHIHSTSKDVGNVDFAALGVSYNFG